MYKFPRIKELRESRNLTQPKCAEIFGVGKNTYIRYESGERVPTIDFMMDVAKYYGVSLDWLTEQIDPNSNVHDG